MNVFATLVIFATVIIIEDIKIPLDFVHMNNEQAHEPMQFPLLFASTTPLIIQSTIISQFCSLSRILNEHWPDSVVSRILGVWRSEQGWESQYAIPVGGIAYYLQPPASFWQAFNSPLHTIIHLLISLITAGVIAYYFINVTSSSPAQLAQSYSAQHLTTPGRRESQSAIEQALNRVIPPTAVIGGVLVQLIACVADCSGSFVSANGLVIVASIIGETITSIRAEYTKIGEKFLI
jgi:protein transport protein SEC61 subunit alpha